MKTLWWQTVGTGNCHLVLLHGWGLNAEVWHCINEELASQFTLHLVDLPGYGRSHGYGAMTLEEMERVNALVTVASSPCFSAQETWPGIKPDVLAGFQQQLSDDFQRTVERFLALQTMGTETARQDARALKQVVLSLPMPDVEVLNGGLEILKTVDLRVPLAALTMPHLRIYGYLDGLVPRKVVPLLDSLWPDSESQIIAKAAHAPFISHPTEFCSALIALSQRLD